MDRTRWIAVFAGGFAIVLLAMVATAEPVPIADRAPSLPFSIPEFDSDITVPTTSPVPLQPVEPQETTADTAEWVTLVMELGIMFLLLAALAWVAKRLWGKRPAITRSDHDGDQPFVVLDEVAEALADDAEVQRQILRTGTPRNAIVECWLRVEGLSERSGLPHYPADTSTEFTARVLSRFDVDSEAVDHMAALYREARFSSHTMGEPERDAALAALDAIHASLREREGADT